MKDQYVIPIEIWGEVYRDHEPIERFKLRQLRYDATSQEGNYVVLKAQLRSNENLVALMTLRVQDFHTGVYLEETVIDFMRHLRFAHQGALRIEGYFALPQKNLALLDHIKQTSIGRIRLI